MEKAERMKADEDGTEALPLKKASYGRDFAPRMYL